MIHGNLDRLHLGDLLQWLQMGGLSGRLTLASVSGERRLDILDGRVVFVSSSVPEERVATWLVREGLLPAVRLAQLLGVALLRRTLFTDAVMSEGGVPRSVLRSSLTRLAELVTTRVMRDETVRFTFDPAYPVRDLLGLDLNVEPNQLVLEAARLEDEGMAIQQGPAEAALPFAGDEFERFFWSFIRTAIPADEPIDGEALAELHGITRDIMGTLAQWLGSSPGLVPMPSGQATEISRIVSEGRRAPLLGYPHAAWNQMVLACSLRAASAPRPQTLGELELAATELDLWVEMTGSEAWRRPQAERLDALTQRVAETWSRAAAAAAPHLGLEPGAAVLAVHMVVVPTDLVLWVLSSLPVPHQRARHALLRLLPQRVGADLARLADFPPAFRSVLEVEEVTPLGACLALSRESVDSASVWPPTVPGDESRLLEVASPAALTSAAAAAREAVVQPVGEQIALG